jgi:hypothetical protein
MIKGIGPTGKYMVISGGTPGTTYVSPGASGAGMLRYNTNMNCVEVNDGSVWKQIETSYASVGLNSEAESLLDWIKEKKREEEAMWVSPGDHPAVKIAKENFNKAKAEMMKAEQQLKATVILSKEYETNDYEAAAS